MPNFTNRPPADDSGPNLRLRRTPSFGKLVAIVTSTDLVGCPTHFFKKRTVPCERPDCEACAAGYAWRWHGYLSAVDQKTNEHFLLEMTAQAAEPFVEYRERHHDLVGCLFEASRLGEHANGRVIIRCKPIDLTQVKLPPTPNLIACVCHIWNLPLPKVQLEGKSKNIPRVTIDVAPKGNDKPVKRILTQT